MFCVNHFYETSKALDVKKLINLKEDYVLLSVEYIYGNLFSTLNNNILFYETKKNLKNFSDVFEKTRTFQTAYGGISLAYEFLFSDYSFVINKNKTKYHFKLINGFFTKYLNNKIYFFIAIDKKFIIDLITKAETDTVARKLVYEHLKLENVIVFFNYDNIASLNAENNFKSFFENFKNFCIEKRMSVQYISDDKMQKMLTNGFVDNNISIEELESVEIKNYL